MRSNGQDRSRGDSHLQDVRVGRHRDKLELIRDSLKPFEQSAGEQSQPAMVTEQQRMMDALVAQGYDRDAAFYALKLVKFASTSAAIDVLKHINHDHAGPLGSSQDTRLLLSTVPTHPSNLLSNGNSQFNQNLKVSSYGNGASNGNLHPTLFPNSNIEDSSSSRSNSPLPPQLPSPTHQSTAYLGPSQINSVGMPSPSRPTRQFTPVAPDYHRSHVHLSTTPSYASDLYQQQLRSHQGGGKPTIYIEKGPDRSALAPKNHYVVRDSYKSPLEGSISAPLCQSTSQFHIGSGHGMTTQTQMNILGNSPHGAPGSYGSGSHPVIRTTFSAAPMRSMVNINVSPAHKDARSFRLDVSGRDGGVSSVHGVSGTVTGVQSIMVDPDQGRVFVGYEDELLPKSYSEAVPSTSNEAQISRHERQERTYGAVRGSVSPNQPVASQTHEQVENVTRSTSPLPELISTRIKQQKYERYMKPCQPRLFCFFMEQHVERLLQQYKERMKRSQQLQREMEAANLPEQMKQKMLDFLQQKESRYMRLRRQKMNKEMFEVIQHIGVGAFGRVSLVKKKDTGQVYAMKSLLKKDVILKHQAAHVKAERDILAEADSPWIVKLFFSFQDDRCLYFIMEYVPGGDMMQLLINTGIFEEKLARFYIAELTCAIEYVHSLGFIHRDIKPDNILIDQQGHIKLTDFGLCTGLRWTHDRRYYGPENDSQSSHARVDSLSLPPEVAGLEQHMKVLNIRHQKKRDQAHSVVGTGNYMAPEVIEKTGHTQLCDWWSVGVILYEMVFGRPPFMSIRDDPKETRHRIKNWQRYLDVSSSAGGGHLSRECINMICQLCCDKTDRIGSGGAREVMEHPWFRGIDFKNLRGTRAEFIPRVEHAEDTSNFDTIEITESPFETVGKRAPNNPAFYEFTFRHFFDTDGQGCPSLRPTQKRPSLAPLMEKRPMLPSVMETGSSHRHEAISSTESIVI